MWSGHSITSSAAVNNVAGNSSPSDVAAFWLSTRSYLSAGRTEGRSVLRPLTADLSCSQKEIGAMSEQGSRPRGE